MSAYNYETVKVAFPAPFVAHVELNRPKKLNAINDTMWTDIGAVFNQLRDDENVRAIVLSGSGRCFTSGLDRTFSHTTPIASHISRLVLMLTYLPMQLNILLTN
jgi:delta(3,5)-delta(2,4)-dienoyl-CoA isomerase